MPFTSAQKDTEKRLRRIWIRPIFALRRQQGEYYNLLQELRLSLPLLTRRNYYSVRAGISAAEKLALRLRFLATGNSQVSMSFSFRIGRATVCFILK
uniref:Uncharacterized protein n=1 Tax=Amphimedon queenslandica TaxID=400682 RepID=A0A1X7UEV8_AMPQE